MIGGHADTSRRGSAGLNATWLLDAFPLRSLYIRTSG
jgi:hypothetical protein